MPKRKSITCTQRLNKFGNKYKSHIVELLGIYVFSATYGFTVNGTGTLGPLAVGGALMVMVFTGAHISGAHFNPAVTIGDVLTLRDDEIEIKQGFRRVLVHLVGAALGVLTSYGITGKVWTISPNYEGGVSYLQAFFAETFWTCVIVSVFLNVATLKSLKGNSFYGLGVGFAYTAASCSVFHISGACFNPALSTAAITGDYFFGKGNFDTFWLYWFSSMLGALLAALLFRLTNTEEYERASYTEF